MSDSEMPSLLSALDEHIDTLEELLDPLTSQPLRTTASKLPVLDQAKLYTLTNYTVNSLLFCALRLQDVDAKEHPVYRELTRTRQYFQKIKDAETLGAAPSIDDQPRARLDKGAATRFVRAGLSGNDRLDQERAARRDAERERAHGKLEALNEAAAPEAPRRKKSKRSRLEPGGGGVDAELEDPVVQKAASKDEKKSKKRKRDASDAEAGGGTEEAGDGRGGIGELPVTEAPEFNGSEEVEAAADDRERDLVASSTASEKKSKKDKKANRFKKSSKAPRAAGEVMRDLLKKGRAKDEAG